MGIKEFIERQSAAEKDNIHDFSIKEVKKQPIFFDPKLELGDFEWQEFKEMVQVDMPKNEPTAQWQVEFINAYKIILQKDFGPEEVSRSFIAAIKADLRSEWRREEHLDFPIGSIQMLVERYLGLIDFLSEAERARIFNQKIEGKCSETLKDEIEQGKDKTILNWDSSMAMYCKSFRRAFPKILEKININVIQRVIQQINETIEFKRGKGLEGAIQLCNLIADFRQAFPEEFKKINLSEGTKKWLINEWRKFQEQRRAEGQHHWGGGVAYFAEWTANLMIITAAEIKISLERVEVIGRKEEFKEEEHPMPIRKKF